jgi:hypothetical protein
MYFDGFQSYKEEVLRKNKLQLLKLYGVGNPEVEVFGWFCPAPPLKFFSRAMSNTTYLIPRQYY